MEDCRLPPELRRLQQELIAQPRPEPPARLRGRVIGGVRAELRGSATGRRWQFAAAAAAAGLVWINLSLSATHATDYHLRFGGRAAPRDAVAKEIERLLPELPPREALRQAVLLQAGADLAYCPSLPSRPSPRVHWNSRDRLFP